MKIEMNVAKLSYVAFGVITAALLLSGCKKDTKNLSFEGTPSFQIDEFINQDEKLLIFPSEVKLSKNDAKTDRIIRMYSRIGIRPAYSDTLLQSEVMTSGLSVRIPNGDTLESTQLIVYAIADGYTNISASRDFTIVDSMFIGGSLTETGIKEDDPFYEDADGRKYYTAQIAGETWMKQNYAGGNCGIPYRNSKAMALLFGKYYTWEEAQNVCPHGWHLSTKEDWDKMIEVYGENAGDYMVNAYFNITEKMWPYWPNVIITNKSGFTAISTGYAVNNTTGDYNFCDYGQYALFWTDAEKDGLGLYKYINVETTELMENYTEKNGIRASVRCVMD